MYVMIVLHYESDMPKPKQWLACGVKPGIVSRWAFAHRDLTSGLRRRLEERVN